MGTSCYVSPYQGKVYANYTANTMPTKTQNSVISHQFPMLLHSEKEHFGDSSGTMKNGTSGPSHFKTNKDTP